jgi:hypothetical protein
MDEMANSVEDEAARVRKIGKLVEKNWSRKPFARKCFKIGSLYGVKSYE